jgi:hypothetical protein
MCGRFHLTTESIKKAINDVLFDKTDRIYKDLLIANGIEARNKVKFSPHLGYPNLLPLAFGYFLSCGL